MFSSSGELASGRASRIGKSLLELQVFLYCNATSRDVLAVNAHHVRDIRKQLVRDRKEAALEKLV